MNQSKGVLSGTTATLVIARLTALRFLRSRILWLAVLFACASLVPALLKEGQSPARRWELLMLSTAHMQLLVSCLLMASAIAEEIEDKTYTYLWSRPFPRWSVLTGKLLAGSIVGVTLFAAVLVAGYFIIGSEEIFLPLRGIAALGVGILTIGCIAASFGIFVPRYALAMAIVYSLVLDVTFSKLAFVANKLSVVFHVQNIAQVGDSSEPLWQSITWLLGIATFWVALGLWRLQRKELSSAS